MTSNFETALFSNRLRYHYRSGLILFSTLSAIEREQTESL